LLIFKILLKMILYLSILSIAGQKYVNFLE